MESFAGNSFATILALRSLLLSTILVAGCMSHESLYSEIAADRTSAYQQWRLARAEPNKTQPIVEGKLGLQDAIKLALVYNKPLQAALADKDVAGGRVLESFSEILPSVTAVGSYTRRDDAQWFNAFLNNYSADLQVRQPLFRAGALSTIRAARVFSALTDETVRGRIQDTIHSVSKNYYDSLLARHLFDVNSEAVVSAEAHLKDVKVKQSQGVASAFDVLRAEVDVSNFRAEMIQQQNRVHLAKTLLLKAMGVSQEADVTLSDELTYEPADPVLEEVMRVAHENRPDLYQAELGVRLQEEAVWIARSNYFPTADAVFTQGWARPDPLNPQLGSWGDRWFGGIEISFPLFDGLRREGRIRQEQAALQKRKIELLDAEEQAFQEIKQALLSLRDAQEFAESQRLNLERATEGLRIAEVGYREGVNTEVEVTDARAALTRAKGLYYQAVYDHTVARLSLRRAMGTLGPKAGDTGIPTASPVIPAHLEEFQAPQPPDEMEKRDRSPVIPESPTGEGNR